MIGADLHDLQIARRKADAVLLVYFVQGMVIAALLLVLGIVIGKKI